MIESSLAINESPFIASLKRVDSALLGFKAQVVVLNQAFQGFSMVINFDYPGYGVSQGKPSPAAIRENLEKSVPLAAAATRFPLAEMGTRGLVFGHSLGAATCLIGAELFGIKRAILFAPFTSTMEMTEVVVHVPLGWLVRHRFDNRARLAELQRRGGHVWIFHGAHDEVIPPSMGRSLAQNLGPAATYVEVRDGAHNDLLEKDADGIIQAMSAARQ